MEGNGGINTLFRVLLALLICWFLKAWICEHSTGTIEHHQKHLIHLYWLLTELSRSTWTQNQLPVVNSLSNCLQLFSWEQENTATIPETGGGVPRFGAVPWYARSWGFWNGGQESMWCYQSNHRLGLCDWRWQKHRYQTKTTSLVIHVGDCLVKQNELRAKLFFGAVQTVSQKRTVELISPWERTCGADLFLGYLQRGFWYQIYSGLAGRCIKGVSFVEVAAMPDE